MSITGNCISLSRGWFVAFMSKQRKRIANVRFTDVSKIETLCLGMTVYDFR